MKGSPFTCILRSCLFQCSSHPIAFAMVLTEEQINFGRIVDMNSFNREITEDEAAVLQMFSLCYLSLLQVLLVALIEVKG